MILSIIMMDASKIRRAYFYTQLLFRGEGEEKGEGGGSVLCDISLMNIHFS